MLAIKAGKNNKTPVFVALDDLLAKKGKDRIKELKENVGRALTAAQAKPVEDAKSIEDLAAALDGMVDERGSPKKRVAASGTPILQPTGERRRTGSHYTPRSLTAPIVKYALEPAFDRLGPDATPEQVLELKVCDPAMGSGAFLVEACRALGERLVRPGRVGRRRAPPFRRTRTRSFMRAGSSRSAASMASTRTRARSISRGCRFGSPRSRATMNSPSSITR